MLEESWTLFQIDGGRNDFDQSCLIKFREDCGYGKNLVAVGGVVESWETREGVSVIMDFTIHGRDMQNFRKSEFESSKQELLP